MRHSPSASSFVIGYRHTILGSLFARVDWLLHSVLNEPMLPRVDLIGFCLPWCYKTLDGVGQQTDSASDLYCGIEERAASLVAGMRVCLVLIREMHVNKSVHISQSHQVPCLKLDVYMFPPGFRRLYLRWQVGLETSHLRCLESIEDRRV